MEEKIKNYVKSIKENYSVASNIMSSELKACAGSIRSTLEIAVKLFWLKKHGKEPVWLINGREEFNLCEALKDSRFYCCFSTGTISDMHVIRRECNDILHQGKELTLDLVRDLLDRLEKCVRAIEEKIKETLIMSTQNKSLDSLVKGKVINNSNIYQTSSKVMDIVNTNADVERKAFWEMLKKRIESEGYPFTFKSRAHYATINQSSATSNLCLSLDFLITKNFLRIGIYINDEKKTPHFNRLFSKKEEIENLMGFKVVWTDCGEKNPNTRRIERHLPFESYNRDDYERLITDAIPIIKKYIEVFSVYLPEIFPLTYKTVDSLRDVSIQNSLARDLYKSYGTKAQAIYDECCKVFGWDSSKHYLFGSRQILYAEEATPEKYSPWFLPHSNWTETKGGNWFNLIHDDVIEEMWKESKYGLEHDKTTRVTFVKRKSGEYVFLGLYVPIEVKVKILNEDIVDRKGKVLKSAGDKVWIKIYKLVSKVYPVEKE